MLHAILATTLALASSQQEGTEHAAEAVAHTPQPPAELIFYLFGVPVTNSIFTAWCVTAILVLFAFFSTRNLRMVPSGLQNFWELVVELWIGVIEQSMGRRGRRFMPLIATAFLFILFSNWIGTLPVVGTVTVKDPHGHDVPLFRSANSDLNVTAAMAVLVIAIAEFSELRSLGPVGYLKGLFLPNPLRPLEILTRPLSLSFRLFGNIFAGEVLVATMIGLAPFALFAFLMLEVFVGLIQALIFSMLTLVFLTIATAHEHAQHEEPHPRAAEAHAPAVGH
jgi:F-type H+-transporting ATPase subunit a